MFIGIDVSKNFVDIASSCGGVNHTRVNPGMVGELLADKGVKLVVVEGSGGYERAAVDALHKAGIAVAIVNPRQVRDFAKAMGRRAKTDKLDAMVLARFAEVIRPQPTMPQDACHGQLKALVTRRRQLLKELTQEKNRLQQSHEPLVQNSSKKMIALLQDEVRIMTDAIHQLLKTHWQQTLKLLMATKGVGPLTAATLIAELPELGHIGRKQIASLAGLAPFTRQSGQWKGKAFCSGGRKALRQALYMAALSAARSHTTIKAFYQNLITRGKPPKVALTAVMRKLLVILNAKMHYNLQFST